MADGTSIEWTDATWNPVRGCSRVSEGCRHCYAEQVAARFSGPGMPYEGLAKRVGGEGRWTGKVRMVPEHLADPLRWRKPRRIFVNSMSDLFHEALTFEQIASVFAVMAAAHQHTYQVLTKRARRALEFCAWLTLDRLQECGEKLAGDMGWCHAGEDDWALPLPNVWLGASVEDQATADARIPLLLQCPAAVRFVSYEPALGPVNLTQWLIGKNMCLPMVGGRAMALLPVGGPDPLDHVDWVIVGGESGPGARPFDIAWARETVRQCREAGVACFVKQLGAHVVTDGIQGPGEWWPEQRPMEDAGRGHWRKRLNNSKGGDWTEWPADLRVREYPSANPTARPHAPGGGAEGDTP